MRPRLPLEFLTSAKRSPRTFLSRPDGGRTFFQSVGRVINNERRYYYGRTRLSSPREQTCERTRSRVNSIKFLPEYARVIRQCAPFPKFVICFINLYFREISRTDGDRVPFVSSYVYHRLSPKQEKRSNERRRKDRAGESVFESSLFTENSVT